MNIAGLSACVQLAVNDNFETRTGWTRETNGADDPPRPGYAGVKVMVWLWLLTLVESFVTVWRLRNDARSVCERSTLCGCVALPIMFNENAFAAVICALVTTATWP